MESLLSQVSRGKGSKVDMAGRYAHKSSDRSGYLDRAREYSRMTLPQTITDQLGQNRGDAANQHGYSGIGAELVNHLSNKITVNMFPIGRSFYKLTFGERLEALIEAENKDPLELAELLVSAEDQTTTYQTRIAARVAYINSVKNLLITGNVLVHLPKVGDLQAIPLDRYVVSRNLSGFMTELIILEQSKFSMLSDDAQMIVKAQRGSLAPKSDDVIDLYTWVYYVKKKGYAIVQSVDSIQLTDVQYVEEEQLPWLALRWNSAYGEDYGRGLVEDHSGDFYVIEFLTEAIAKGMALMADIKYLIKPGSVTDIDEIATAPTGEWIFGQLDDIGVLQLEKYADFTPIVEVLKDYERRVGRAFLMNSAMRRDAERVTTVELRIDAQELEVSMGGNYSGLGQKWLTPMAKLYLHRIGFPFPGGVVPTIVSGLESFGLTGELEKLYQWSEIMQLPNTWPEALQSDIKFDDYARLAAANLSMKLPFLMTKEEKIAKQQAQQAQQDGDLVKETVANTAPKVIEQSMKE